MKFNVTQQEESWRSRNTDKLWVFRFGLLSRPQNQQHVIIGIMELMSISDKRNNLSPVIFVTFTDGGNENLHPSHACCHKRNSLKVWYEIHYYWNLLYLNIVPARNQISNSLICGEISHFMVVPFICHLFLWDIFGEKSDKMNQNKYILCIFVGCGTLLVLDETETGVVLVRR